MRKVLPSAISVALLLGGGLVGLTSSPVSASPGASGLKSIFFANPLPDYPAFATANKCFLAETKKLHIKGSTSGPSGLSVNNQFTLDGISQAIADHYGAIIMVPIEPPQFTAAIKQARAHKILVATINTGNATTNQNVELGTNYSSQGATLVAKLALRSGPQNIIEVGNAPGGAQALFVNGIEAALPSYPNVHFLAQVFDNGDPNQTTDVVNTALEANPTANVVVSWEGTAVQGMVTAIDESNDLGKVVAVVNDITPESVSGMNGGEIYAIMKQNFCTMATEAVLDLVALKNGKRIPSRYVDTGITWVTKSNLAANQ